ncbi:ABC transporter ATP-binding protein [Bordetella genomosp. 12]|uniref:ABC transporter ATP-binding protein n=1 Tax=Bordetella genomosp. 12 TaxID=463035 RepID=A0A261VUB3_9BORD|nr:ABC transporter ATP-binding protein [Bordetella genomosp. 12]OZI77696.1 ABC transporter ATP-binding protein [Bordetella genomosp. 12]
MHKQHPDSAREASAPAILEGRGLRRDFRGFTAVDGVDISVREGSIHGLIGPNGAGKTTVFNLLSKFLAPSSGRILLDGQDVTALKPAEIARRGLVRSFQISAIFDSLSTRDNLRVALQRQAGLATQMLASPRRLDALNDRAMALLADVGLTAFANVRAGTLSYGRKRALELAATLALEPRIMLLDEPMAGMAHEDVDAVRDLIRKAARGRTVVMVEHNLPVVAALCDHVTVLERGKVIAQGSYTEVSNLPRVREAYIGVDDD